jgi:hypothetical protein
MIDYSKLPPETTIEYPCWNIDEYGDVYLLIDPNTTFKLEKVGSELGFTDYRKLDQMLTSPKFTYSNRYYIDYIDPNYPCDCDCHTEENILHIDACCYDNSYHGIVQYIREISSGKHLVKTNDNRTKVFPTYSIYEASGPNYG